MYIVVFSLTFYTLCDSCVQVSRRLSTATQEAIRLISSGQPTVAVGISSIVSTAVVVTIAIAMDTAALSKWRIFHFSNIYTFCD